MACPHGALPEFRWTLARRRLRNISCWRGDTTRSGNVIGRDKLVAILERHFGPADFPCEPPVNQDWEELERALGCSVPAELKLFLAASVNFDVWPEVLRVSSRQGDRLGSLILDVYHQECSDPSWRREMVPFIAHGDGDFSCFSTNPSLHGSLFVFHHETLHWREIEGGFEGWLQYFINLSA